MDIHAYPLVVGAGPVGMAASLFLAAAGVSTRLIEMRSEPSAQSKALAVNPRSLEILATAGLTEKMIATGRQISSANLWRGGRLAASIEFSHLDVEYPFMLALSQSVTERLLEEALGKYGVTVERGVRLVDSATNYGAVNAVLETSHGRENYRARWMLAADGAHSTARERVPVDFPGSTFRRQWELADVPLDTDLAENSAHVFFCRGGEFQFMIRVVDPGLESKAAGPLWRVIGNRPNVLERLAAGRPLGPPVWSSDFTISHRICRSLSVGNIYFAGDAAHIHSPIGARGMNLGIEDAWVFAQLVLRNQLGRYDSLRREVDGRVVRQVAVFSRLVTGEPSFLRLLRPVLFLFAKFGIITPRLKAIITGTDHDLADLSPSATRTRDVAMK